MIAQASPKYNAVTAVGDFTQRLTATGLADPSRAGLELSDERLVFLDYNKRQTSWLSQLSHDFRINLHGDKRPLRGERPKIADEKPRFLGHGDEATVQGLKNVLLTTRSDRPHYTMAVLCPTGKRATELEAKLHEEMWSNNILTRVSDNDDAATLCDAYHMHFTTLLQSKGLEFDAVFVVDVDAYNLSLATDLAALYVALSRAGRRLGVTSRAAVPGKLSEVFSRHLTDYEEQIPRPGSVEGPS